MGEGSGPGNPDLAARSHRIGNKLALFGAANWLVAHGRPTLLCRCVFALGPALPYFFRLLHFVCLRLRLWLGVARRPVYATGFHKCHFVIVEFLARLVVTFTLNFAHIGLLRRVPILRTKTGRFPGPFILCNFHSSFLSSLAL